MIPFLPTRMVRGSPRHRTEVELNLIPLIDILSVPLVSSRPSWRTITSSRNVGSVTGPPAALGRSSCRTVMRANTAVINRNVTSTVKMSIIGTSSSPAGLRKRRKWVSYMSAPYPFATFASSRCARAD